MDCIIVDDIKMERTALKNLIAQVDFLNLKHECADPVEAFNYLQKESVDLVFLDVEMPGMTGIDLIKNLEKRPLIIFISAHKDYAIEAFELNVVDYLMKPVELSRFMVAISRAREMFITRDNSVDMQDKEYIFVRSNSILSKIKIKDIIYIQALGDYVNIFTPEKRYAVHITLKGMEEQLPVGKFYRLHRSYIVSLDHIDSVEENTAIAGKHMLPIGENFKKEMLRRLNLI